MIIDKIHNWRNYFTSPVFEKIFAEIAQFTPETKNGTYKISSDYYIKVMDYKTKFQPEIIESHRKEIDIQIVLSGKERIKVYESKAVEVIELYNEKSDCQFYKNISEPFSDIVLEPDFMAVFFPDDIHHPQFVAQEIESIKKIVIKIDEKLFSQK